MASPQEMALARKKSLNNCSWEEKFWAAWQALVEMEDRAEQAERLLRGVLAPPIQLLFDPAPPRPTNEQIRKARRQVTKPPRTVS